MNKIFSRFFAGLCLILLSATDLFAQPAPPNLFEFRFFNRNGQAITWDGPHYTILIKKPDGSDVPIRDIHKRYGYITVSTEESELYIDVISIHDTMHIRTASSIDSIPFLSGRYAIPTAYGDLFSIITHAPARILKREWELLKVDDLNQKSTCLVLKQQACIFWENRKRNILLKEKPQIDQVLYNPEFSPNIYAWDWMRIFVSRDKGLNWELLVQAEPPYERPSIAFKDRHALVLTKYLRYARPTKAEILISHNDGVSWEPDSILTKAGFHFVAFDNKQHGIAFSIIQHQYGPATLSHTSQDGGKTWKAGVTVNELHPRSVAYWKKNMIVLYCPGNLALVSEDGGQSWNEKKQGFNPRGSWPDLISEGPFGQIMKVDHDSQKSTVLLTLRKRAYPSVIASGNIWCAPGPVMLVSQDQGQNWNYYCNPSGARMLSIIDERYLFDGSFVYNLHTTVRREF